MNAEMLKNHLKANCLGRGKTVSGSSLEHTLHISGNELRRQVNRLRRDGVPFAGCRDGYFYAANAGEVYATIRQLRRMEQGLAAAIQGLEQALERFGGDVL